METETKYQHYDYEEVELSRPFTLTYETKDNVSNDELLQYLLCIDSLNLRCIQRIPREETDYFEVTFNDEESRGKNEIKLGQEVKIGNKRLYKVENRGVKKLIRKPLINVVIYEAPCELSSEPIKKKLENYGTIKGEIYRHKYRTTEIENGNRSVLFEVITKNIPTTIYVHGNRLKIKYDGQDREPFCSFCKIKGHYRGICPELKKREEEMIRREEEMIQREREREEEEENREEERREEEEIEVESDQESTWGNVPEFNNWHEEVEREEEVQSRQQNNKLSYSEATRKQPKQQQQQQQQHKQEKQDQMMKKRVREIEVKYQRLCDSVSKKKKTNELSEEERDQIRKINREMKKKKKEFLDEHRMECMAEDGKDQ